MMMWDALFDKNFFDNLIILQPKYGIHYNFWPYLKFFFFFFKKTHINSSYMEYKTRYSMDGWHKFCWIEVSRDCSLLNCKSS